MSYRAGVAALAITVSLSGAAVAKTLPTVQLSPSNQPAQCTTPGRLMAFLRERNPRLRAKFNNIAADYMRHGRELGIRWDYGFFQMVVETNSLKYTGDVSYTQNNFAGLGATGGGVRGERFRSVSDGVRAHLQHLMMYAGIHVADPVADRTRKVQSWGILNKWRKRFNRPITFSDVGSQWAPHDRGYADDIETIAQAFYSTSCRRPDPQPELMASAGATNNQRTTSEPRYDADKRAGLGASNVARSTRPSTNYRTLNARSTSVQSATRSRSGTAKQRKTAAKFAAPALKPAAPKCRVWTASYGGRKATIIRSDANDTTNYTVLDVNQGREDAEAKAYIAAYAAGGRRIGDFPTKSAAMAKAFKLCPKG